MINPGRKEGELSSKEDESESLQSEEEEKESWWERERKMPSSISGEEDETESGRWEEEAEAKKMVDLQQILLLLSWELN